MPKKEMPYRRMGRNRAVSSLIPVACKLVQWQDCAGAVLLELLAEDELQVDLLVAPGHTLTSGYTAPAHSVLGRVDGFQGKIEAEE